jgi:hypothetical protein
VVPSFSYELAKEWVAEMHAAAAAAGRVRSVRRARPRSRRRFRLRPSVAGRPIAEEYRRA